MKTKSCAKSIQKVKTNGDLEIEEKHEKKYLKNENDPKEWKKIKNSKMSKVEQ